LSNAFSKLDSLNDFGADHAGDGPKPDPKPLTDKPAPKPEAAKPAEKPAEVKPDEAAANKPPEKPAEKATEKPVEKPADKPEEKLTEAQKASPWRMFRDEQKKSEELSKKLSVIEAELAKAKSAPPSPAEDPEKQKLTARLAELEDHMRYVDYTKSSEYQEQYQQPYERTATEAVQRATQLKVTDENGQKRNMTPDEFWAIVHMGDEDDAIEAAGKLFGEGSVKAATVIERRNEIIRAHQRAEEAKEKYRKEAGTRAQQTAQQKQAQERQQAEQQAKRAEQFKSLVKQGEEHEVMKAFFTAAEGDAEGKEIVEKYRREADRVFGEPAKEGEEVWDDDKRLLKLSVARNRAAAFMPLKRQYEQTKARVAELEKQLKEFQDSVPGGGAVKGDENPPQMSAYEQAMAKLEKLNG